jgi:PAS domain S-box-containing protein
MSTNHIVLIVDDDPSFRKVLYDILQDKGYIPISVATGKAALDRVADRVPSVALIDLRLEDMSGLEVMGEIKKCSPTTQSILLTGYASQASAIEAINLGAYSYVQKPYDIEQLLVTVRRAVEKREAARDLRESEEKYRTLVEQANDGIVIVQDGLLKYANPRLTEITSYAIEEVMDTPFINYIYPDERSTAVDRYNRRMAGEKISAIYESAIRLRDGRRIDVELNAGATTFEGKLADLIIIRDITERRRVEGELQQSLKKLRRALDDTVHALTSVIEMRDPYTAGHQRRVTELACAIARGMDLSEDRIEGLLMAGLIHDIGKISIPAEVLSKPGKLNELEWGMIKTHPEVGYDILKTVEFPWPVAQIVLQHHERMDGSGYPQGLSGDEIMLEARILAVADVVEAMASHRPYRGPLGVDEALEEVSQKRGTLYAVEVVETCLKLFTDGVVALE